MAGATLEEIHSGRIRLLLPGKAVVFTGTSGRIVRKLDRVAKGVPTKAYSALYAEPYESPFIQVLKLSRTD